MVAPDRRQNLSEGQNPAATPGTTVGVVMNGPVSSHLNGKPREKAHIEGNLIPMTANSVTCLKNNAKANKSSPKRRATILRTVEPKVKKRSSITTLKPPARMLSSFRV